MDEDNKKPEETHQAETQPEGKKPLLTLRDDTPEDMPEKTARAQKVKKEIKSWLIALAEALVVVFIIKSFFFTLIQVKGPSMQDTLYTGERLFVSVLDVKLSGCDRYDVVICHFPGEKDYFVKRVIGLPGETIESRGGVTYINGEPIDEGFLMPGNTRRYALIDFGPVEIPEDSYFVMGDNRDNSNDSRAVGCIKKSEMVGQAQFIWWPLNKIQGLRYSPEE